MTNTAPRRTLSTRRLILLATVANLGVAALVFGHGGYPQSLLPAPSSAQAAESMQRPAGFGDLVERVKPAVISVRVKKDADAKMMSFDEDLPLPPNSQIERFMRRFGMPQGQDREDREQRRAPRNHAVTGQGSGFFITADGYAVTNNHVVDGAKTVEVVTDDGKTHSAKVKPSFGTSMSPLGFLGCTGSFAACFSLGSVPSVRVTLRDWPS